jgi:hypothetical protein
MVSRLGLSFFPTVITTALVLTLLLVAPAQGETHLGWSENAKVGGVPMMSFRVATLSIGKTSWSARISFRNLSHRTVRVGSSFGLAFYSSAKLTPTTKPEAFGVANKYSHPLPARLVPGASWTGVIAGPGRPKITGKTWSRVVFGPFVGLPSNLKTFIWITDHSLPLTFGSKASGSGGLVI